MEENKCEGNMWITEIEKGILNLTNSSIFIARYMELIIKWR